MRIVAFLLISFMVGVTPAYALDEKINVSEGVQSFQQDKDAWRRSEQKEKQFLSAIVDSIGKAAALNIEKAEQAFCYEVETKPVDYDGYTIDGMALTGFCGVLNSDLIKLVKEELFMSPQNVLINKNENCIIKPKIILRFVRGVDNTDILLSSPCYSYSVFYGGKIRPFNAKPAAEIIDALINPLAKKSVKFVSPALLNQLLPVGVAQSEEQKKLMEEQNGHLPKRAWENTAESVASPSSYGWNKLNP